jgi:hypothetical protein
MKGPKIFLKICGFTACDVSYFEDGIIVLE